MEKTVKLNGNFIGLKASGGVLINYKQQFGVDYNADIKTIAEMQDEKNKLLGNMIAGSRLIWSMAKAADPKTPNPELFYNIYSEIDINSTKFNADTFTQLLETCNKLFEQSFTSYIDKESDRYVGGDDLTTESLIANAVSCGLSTDDVYNLPVGMVLNTIKEYCDIHSGKEKERIKIGTQTDFDNF